MTRIAITGGPRTGKSTLAASMAAELRLPIIATDDFACLGWSEASAAVGEIFAFVHAQMIVEGVAVPRALRKALAFRSSTRSDRPIDKLIVLTTPHVEQTPGQVVMAKGVETVLAEILPDLERLGVEVERR